MRFSIISAFAFVASVMGQTSTCNANCFSESVSGTINYPVGTTVPLAWTNKQGNTVTIRLAYGSRNDLTIVSTIADHIANTGSFTWQIDSDLPQRVDYALEIINDDSPDQINYSSQFDILNPDNIASNPPLSSATTATTDSASTASDASTTGTDSASTTGTGTATVTVATLSTGTLSTQTTGAASTRAPSSTQPSVTVPTGNAASRPAIGAVGGLLAVAAGFAIAL